MADPSMPLCPTSPPPRRNDLCMVFRGAYNSVQCVFLKMTPRFHRIPSHYTMATIRVLSAEGEETIWPHAAAAEQAIALKDWIDDTGGGGVFKGTKDAGVSASA